MFIRGLCGHSGSLWCSLGSSGAVGFTWVRPGGREDNSGRQLGSLDFAMGVVGFFLSPWVNSGSP